MAVDRRIIFSSYVVPTRIDTMEEDSISKTSFLGSTSNDTLSKTLGGKGSASIDAAQWGDGWVSFSHQGAYWEDQSDVWELQGEAWSGKLSISDTAKDLTDDSNDLAFLYIKNTGTTNNALIALDGGTSYYIQIPPGGSVHLRGDGTQLLCSEVFVKSNTSTTTIEFIIAK